MKFQILIPTYNREKDLQGNLLHLRDQLVKYKLIDQFGIAVSDNASTDGTASMLSRLKSEWPSEIKLDIVSNTTNVGLEQNAVNLLLHATAPYIIWLGDDDLLADGYLKFIAAQFEEDQIGWMIPGLIGVDKHGNKTEGRLSAFDFRSYGGGYSTLLELSHFGHQMSGLVVKRKDLATVYLAQPEWRNPYLFIFFLSYNQLYYKGVYAPSFKTLINNYNPKDWGYNEIGLLDEVFKSYYYLKNEIGFKKLNKLLLRFVLMHSYRFNFNEGYKHVLYQWKQVCARATEAKGLKLHLWKLLTKEYMVRRLK